MYSIYVHIYIYIYIYIHAHIYRYRYRYRYKYIAQTSQTMLIAAAQKSYPGSSFDEFQKKAHPTTTCPRSRPHAAAAPLRLADPGIGRASYLDGLWRSVGRLGGKSLRLVIGNHFKCEKIDCMSSWSTCSVGNDHVFNVISHVFWSYHR